MTRRELYPGYHVLDQRGHWDQATREVVLDRVHNVPPFRHLDAHQQATLEALCNRVIPQTDRPPERRVPIAPWIDQSMGQTTLGGFRYDDMPANDVAWYWGLTGLDQTAEARYGASFHALSEKNQDDVLAAIRAGDPPGEIWQRMPARRWWITIALNQISGVYYAHPFAWDEIGFGGPAYPRGYASLNFGAREPWEVDEAPDDGRSRR
jgi:hypothetical protein